MSATGRGRWSGRANGMLEIRPISIAAANAYVEQHHRHHGAKTGCRFAIAVYDEQGGLHGVAICANPVARNADDGLTLEVSRVCTDGTHNACSILYGSCARIAKEMGFRRIITYILESEDGTSLKASGWHCDGDGFGAVNWDVCNSKRTIERNATKQMSIFPEKRPPEEMKKRWSKEIRRR